MTRAPGRLDVMGGIADYSGSLVLQLPLAQACHVAVQTHPLPLQRVWRHMQSRHVRVLPFVRAPCCGILSHLANRRHIKPLALQWDTPFPGPVPRATMIDPTCQLLQFQVLLQDTLTPQDTLVSGMAGGYRHPVP